MDLILLDDDFKIRIGIATGRAIGGVFRGNNIGFDIFGDTVNIASRMESNGRPNEILICEKTKNMIEQYYTEKDMDILTNAATLALMNVTPYTFNPVMVSAKGKGIMQAYFVSVS